MERCGNPKCTSCDSGNPDAPERFATADLLNLLAKPVAGNRAERRAAARRKDRY